MVHVYGFSPRWIRMWTLKVPACFTTMLQIGHLYSSEVVCLRLAWRRKHSGLNVLKSQSLHSNSFSRLESCKNINGFLDSWRYHGLKWYLQMDVIYVMIQAGFVPTGFATDVAYTFRFPLVAQSTVLAEICSGNGPILAIRAGMLPLSLFLYLMKFYENQSKIIVVIANQLILTFIFWADFNDRERFVSFNGKKL